MKSVLFIVVMLLFMTAAVNSSSAGRASRNAIFAFVNEIRNETRLGPTLYLASPMLDGDPPVWPGSRVILNAEQAETAVLEYKKTGYDFIKIYSLLSTVAFDGIITAAKKHGMRVVGHVPSYNGIARILESGGVASLEHTHGYYQPLEMDSSPIKGRWD